MYEKTITLNFSDSVINFKDKSFPKHFNPPCEHFERFYSQ